MKIKRSTVQQRLHFNQDIWRAAIRKKLLAFARCFGAKQLQLAPQQLVFGTRSSQILSCVWVGQIIGLRRSQDLANLDPSVSPTYHFFASGQFYGSRLNGDNVTLEAETNQIEAGAGTRIGPDRVRVKECAAHETFAKLNSRTISIDSFMAT